MTGIERLRQMAEDFKSVKTSEHCTFIVNTWRGRYIDDAIDDIADQIEREADVETVRSDAMRAWEWVREHGGLDHVKAEWCSRVPFDIHEKRRQRLLGHIAECETALGRRNQRIEELGHRVNDLTTENAELRKRAVPEGMEWLLEVWPMWSNGEYCRFGDWWTADRYGDYEPRQLRRLVIYTPELLDEWEQGDGESYGYEWDFMRPSELDYRPDKVEPPAPAVPAADGEPLEAGQTVWHIDTGDEFYVSCFSGGMVNVSDKKGGGLQLLPSQLTHTKPEPPKRCRDCRHWQGDPSASHIGVCFNSYRERCCVDSYAAQLDYTEACEDFEGRGE